ncbi:DUF4238 domain-containing protein [Aurantiacibacter sp. MUD61]|uniref:DUF4238 domain-containing protein n=1 Tax=Aurantiacibacter sp. MUD61 TaxID=3009083 RepID=UPI0022F0E2D7|nr:DUF4238 domain-containing protein [Aurantiacibacter sp. MUD61]
MQKSRRHHYIPQFWIKRWADENGFVKRYRKFGLKLDIRSEPPKSVGYFYNLYDLPEGLRQDVSLEELFFKPLDDKASKVFARLNEETNPTLDGEETATLAIFILSLLHRSPDSLAASREAAVKQYIGLRDEVREKYGELRTAADPPTFEEYESLEPANAPERAFYRSFANYMVNDNLIDFLANMHWRLFRRVDGMHPLLLSDDPIARTNGFKKKDGHLAFPLSPNTLIVGFFEKGFADQAVSIGPEPLFEAINRQTVGAARHFVVADTERHTRFISNRFGRQLRPPFGEQILNRQN